jgi:hypothetical protein
MGLKKKTCTEELQKGGPEKTNSSSYRWAVGATREGELELQLQVIPLPVTEVKAKPLLAADNVAVHIPRSWPIKGLVFDGQAGLKGPVLVLFSSAPGELGERLVGDPDSFKLHLNKVMRGWVKSFMNFNAKRNDTGMSTGANKNQNSLA